MAADVVELTRELVATRTHPPGDEAKAASLVGERLEAAGLDVVEHEFAPGRTSLIARTRTRGERPALCLTGHLDTVPLGRADWSRDPFDGEIDDDRLYGRGTSDMKGGTAAIIVAAERIAALGEGAAGLELVLCAGEETGCEGALALTGSLGRCGAVLVAEPTTDYPAWRTRAWCGPTRSRAGRPPTARCRTWARTRSTSSRGRWRGWRTSRSRRDEAPAARPADGLAREFLGRDQHQLGPGPRDRRDRRPHGARAWTATPCSRRCVNGSATRSSWSRGVVVLDPVDTDPGDEWVRSVFEVMAPLIGETPEPRGLAYFTDAAALSRPTARRPRSSAAPATPSRPTARTSRAPWRRWRPARGALRRSAPLVRALGGCQRRAVARRRSSESL